MTQVDQNHEGGIEIVCIWGKSVLLNGWSLKFLDQAWHEERNTVGRRFRQGMKEVVSGGRKSWWGRTWRCPLCEEVWVKGDQSYNQQTNTKTTRIVRIERKLGRWVYCSNSSLLLCDRIVYLRLWPCVLVVFPMKEGSAYLLTLLVSGLDMYLDLANRRLVGVMWAGALNVLLWFGLISSLLPPALRKICLW